MNKFTGDEADEAEIEIVQPFDRPMTAYLNRYVSLKLSVCLNGLTMFQDLW